MNPIVHMAMEYKKCNYKNNVRTVIPSVMLNSIVELSNSVAQLPGDVCEVGVWRGAVGIIFGEIFKDKTVHLFDTFEGIPFHDEIYDNTHRQGDFGRQDEHGRGHTEYEEVKDTLSIYPNILIHKGVFPHETAQVVADKKFCFVHLDVDVYQSYKECLEFFYPRMVEQGLILLDDYKFSTCAGATVAIDNFCTENNIKLHTHHHQYYMQRINS